MYKIDASTGTKWLVENGVRIQQLGKITPYVSRNMIVQKNTDKSKNMINSSNGEIIKGTEYDDTIFNSGTYAKVNAGKGNDLIMNYGNSVSIHGGTNDDIILNYGNYSTLEGDSGNDYLYTDSNTKGITLYGGRGNDTLTGSTSSGNVYLFHSYDGNNVITNYGVNDTLHFYNGPSVINNITKSSIKTSVNGSDRIIYLDGGTRVTLQGAASKTIKIKYGVSGSMTIDPSIIGTGKNITNYTRYATLEGTSYNDTFNNYASNVKIIGGAGNDNIYAAPYGNTGGKYLTIDAGTGNDSGGADDDTINSQGGGQGVTINGGSGNDVITGSSYGETFIFGNYDGYDVITNYDTNDTIHLTAAYSVGTNYKSGSDYIINTNGGSITLKNAASKKIKVQLANGSMTTLNSGKSAPIPGPDDPTIIGGQNITNYTNNKSVNGTSYNDIIKNWGNDVKISSGAGRDSIYSEYGYRVTINGGAGNDTMTGSNYADVFQFGNSDGNDVITNYGTNDTLHLTAINSASSIKSSVSGSNRIITAGNTKITLQGASTKKIKVKLANGSMTTISGTTTIKSGGSSKIPSGYTSVNVTTNSWYYNQKSKVVINGSSGDNRITNYASNVIVNGNAGKDYITSWDKDYDDNKVLSNVTLNGGAGNDTIYSFTNQSSISGGDGNDTLIGCADYVTINGGKGNDTIQAITYNNVIQYANGDGNDVITYFNTDTKIKITSGSYSTLTSGNDVIIKVGSGKMTLKDAKGTTLNITGTRNYEERWFLEDDDNFISSDVSSILKNDNFISNEQGFNDFNSELQLNKTKDINSLTYSQIKNK